MKNQKNTQSTPAKKSSKELYVEYQRVLAEERAEAKKQQLGPTAAQKKVIKEFQKEYKQFQKLSIDLPYKIEGVLKVNELIDPYDAEMYFPGGLVMILPSQWKIILNEKQINLNKFLNPS